MAQRTVRTLAATLILAALMVFPVAQVRAAELLNDSWEDENFTNPDWDSNNFAPWSIVEPPTDIHGSFALKCNSTISTFKWVYTSDFDPANLPWSFSFYWRYDSIGTWGVPNKWWTIAYWYNDDPSIPATALNMNNSAVLGFAEGGNRFWSGTTLASGNWHFLEVYVNVTATYLYVNETHVYTQAALTEQVNSYLGFTCTAPNHTGEFIGYWDAVRIAEELLGEPPPYDNGNGNGGGVTAVAMNEWIMLVGFVCFVAPPFVIAKRAYGKAANVIILLFVMVIGIGLLTAGFS